MMAKPIDNLLHSFFRFLSASQQGIAVDAVYEAFHLIWLTSLLIAICELVSFRTVQKLRRTSEGKSLHNSGIVATGCNFLLSVPVHIVSRLNAPAGDIPRDSILDSISRVVAFLVLQNFAYYYAHMAMHTPKLYWMHRYHHRYNTYVTPSSANAVTVSEFLFAYILPPAFINTMLCLNEVEWKTTVSVLSVFNILVHTPVLEAWTERYLPKWWVGASVHGEHHRKITKNFASPMLNLDYILGGDTEKKVV